MSTTDAFFEPLGGGRFASTAWTTGPWDPGAQHAGPPAALMARALELCEPRPEMVMARITVEILGPVPVDELSVEARVVRPGRRVEMVEATMTAGGREVTRARGWRIAAGDAPAVPPRERTAPPLPGPEGVAFADHDPTPGQRSPHGWVDGYLSAIEWRGETRAGLFVELGPAAYWTRLRVPLVDGEEPTGLQRVMAVADSGNGVSAELDLSSWHFINPELTVHLHREPVGEWVCLDAQTTISTGGVGLATSVLSDEQSPVAVGAQSLLVAPR